jgi:hypothetical protein
MAPPGRPLRPGGTIRVLIGARLLIGLVVAALLLIGGGAVTRTSAATAVTTTLVATDDAYVSASRPTKTFGTADRLQVDASPVLRSYLKLDLSSIDGTVTSAVLELTATSASKVGFGVREVADSSWSESRLTYAKAPVISGSIGVSVGAFAAKQVLSLDLTASVKAGIRSFALVGRGSSTALSVGSSENRKLAARPRLIVTHTPPNWSKGPCGVFAKPPRGVDHVIWIWMENKPYDAVIGSSSAPYENQLAAACGLATNYHAVAHPSLPNYIAATSGSGQGIADDGPPSSHPLDVASIYSQVKATGKTWRSYQESAPGNCPLAPGGQYAVKHDPAPYYPGIRSDCAIWDVPMGTTASGHFLNDLTNGTLPAFSFVTPNLCNDTHDCPVSTGDAWLRSWFDKILTSSSYRQGRTVVFLTWDEDDHSGPNRVPLIVVSPSTPVGTRSGALFDHYALLKTTEQVLGITTFLGHAGDVDTSSMASTFNLG